MIEQKINEETNTLMLCFVSTLEKHLQSNQYQDLFFEISHMTTKYVNFLFQLNVDFGFFIKTMTKQTVYFNNFARKSGFSLQFFRKSAF